MVVLSEVRLVPSISKKLAKVKKFAEGKSVTDKFLDWATDKDTRSVMDIPENDMRNPRYRKELEEKQALETSSPELALVGPAKGASAAAKAASVEGRGAVRGFSEYLSPAPRPNRIPEIGEKLPGNIHKQNLKDLKKYEDSFTPEQLKKQAREYTKKDIQAYKEANIPDEATRKARKVQRIKDDVATQAMSGTAFGLSDVVNSAKRNEEYKKGGKVRSASARADGCCVRGKTRA